MNVVDYCKGMEMELTAWKAKMFDLTRKVESLGSKEREKVLPNIQDLNMLIVEMSISYRPAEKRVPHRVDSPEEGYRQGLRRYARQIRTDHGIHWETFTRVDSGLIFLSHTPRKGLEDFSEPFLITRMRA